MHQVNKIVTIYIIYIHKKVWKFRNFTSVVVKILVLFTCVWCRGFIAKKTFISLQNLCPLYWISVIKLSTLWGITCEKFTRKPFVPFISSRFMEVSKNRKYTVVQNRPCEVGSTIMWLARACGAKGTFKKNKYDDIHPFFEGVQLVIHHPRQPQS